MHAVPQPYSGLEAGTFQPTLGLCLSVIPAFSSEEYYHGLPSLAGRSRRGKVPLYADPQTESGKSLPLFRTLHCREMSALCIILCSTLLLESAVVYLKQPCCDLLEVLF